MHVFLYEWITGGGLIRESGSLPQTLLREGSAMAAALSTPVHDQSAVRVFADKAAGYGVPGRFLVAFWGLETAYGKIPGDFPVVNALATLAYDGRRGAMFRSEMFNALTILDQGHITLDRMKGSWAALRTRNNSRID